MPRIKKSSGLTVLYRAKNQWHVFEEGVTPQEFESVMRSCKAATLSSWHVGVPPAIAEWMVANPTAKEEDMPRRVQEAARKQIENEVKLMTEGLQLVKSILSTIPKPRPTKREVRQAQKAEASRRKR